MFTMSENHSALYQMYKKPIVICDDFGGLTICIEGAGWGGLEFDYR